MPQDILIYEQHGDQRSRCKLAKAVKGFAPVMFSAMNRLMSKINIRILTSEQKYDIVILCFGYCQSDHAAEYRRKCGCYPHYNEIRGWMSDLVKARQLHDWLML